MGGVEESGDVGLPWCSAYDHSGRSSGGGAGHLYTVFKFLCDHADHGFGGTGSGSRGTAETEGVARGEGKG